jgi:hypothetical protein
MAASVQGWKKKWFYIKDQKTASSDKFGMAHFDANKNLMKLTSWDSTPTEAEIEGIKPLLTRIHILKSATGGALTGTQLMVFFLQRHKLVSPKCGRILAQKILLECPRGPREKGSRQTSESFDYSHKGERDPSFDN